MHCRSVCKPKAIEVREGFRMDWKSLQDTPPWEWPEGASKMLLGALRDDRTPESDRLLAVELAGVFGVVDDELVDALLSIVASGERSAEVRGKAAISLGPVLEHADTAGFEDDDDAPITEATYHRVRESLQRLYTDARVPKDVRRRILEASVRAPQDWHGDAIRTAFRSDDEASKLTAVFCMRFVPGFDALILEALATKNPGIHYEAVQAAGNRELDDAWPHVVDLLSSGQTAKPLLLAAIEAAASIRPGEVAEVLVDLADSDDEDIAAAVDEALAMAEGLSAFEDDDAGS